MTITERREMIREMLLEDESDRSISLALQCSRELVARVRRETPDVPTKRRGRDGKVYTFGPRTSPAGQKVGTLYRRAYAVLRVLRTPEGVAMFAGAPRSVRATLGSVALELAATVARLRKSCEEADSRAHVARREALGIADEYLSRQP